MAEQTTTSFYLFSFSHYILNDVDTSNCKAVISMIKATCLFLELANRTACGWYQLHGVLQQKTEFLPGSVSEPLIPSNLPHLDDVKGEACRQSSLPSLICLICWSITVRSALLTSESRSKVSLRHKTFLSAWCHRPLL